MTQISLIVAYANQRVIGKNNRMPWHLPEDLAHFKRTTLGAPVIMGRKTWEAIGKPLPGRRNIVISRNPNLSLNDAVVTHSLSEALSYCKDVKEVFIIGGAQIYAQALPLATRLVITEIEQQYDGDAFFPEIDFNQWQEVERTRHLAQMPNDFYFSIIDYRRRAAHNSSKHKI